MGIRSPEGGQAQHVGLHLFARVRTAVVTRFVMLWGGTRGSVDRSHCWLDTQLRHDTIPPRMKESRIH